MFGYSARFVGALQRRPERYYRTFLVHKGKKKREIQAPRVALKVIQKWFAHHLAQAVELDECVFGFVPGRSAPHAAARHCGANWVYAIDLADFFRSTPRERVEAVLRDLGYPSHGADLAARLCCYGDYLAQGSPASPVLSNLVLRPLDGSLKQIAIDAGATYTRYADDLVFSGSGDFPAGLDERARQAVAEDGWRLAEGKEHLAKLPQRLKVHGLLVHGPRPRLTKGYRNRLRAFRHLIEHNRVKEEDLGRLQGHLAYAESVEGFKPA